MGLEDIEIIVTDPSKLFQPFGVSKSVGTFSTFLTQEGQRGLFVDTGVGSPRLSANAFTSDLKLDSEAKAIPAAAGAIAAAAIANRMHGPKEDRRLAIVLVGSPARGKTFTAAKLTRYLPWLGHETKHFNVGKYRRLKHGTNQSADFFRGDNSEAMEARNEVAALEMDDMLSWMHGGGQVGIFDATNSTRKRRNMLMKMEGLASALHEVSSEARDTQEKLLAKQAKLEDAEAQVEELKSALENTKERYEVMLDEARYEIGCLKNSAERSETDACNLLDEWKRNAELLEDQADEAEQSKKSSPDALALVSKQLEETNALLQDAKSEISVLIGKVGSLEEEVTRQKANLYESKSHLDVAQQEALELGNTVKILKSELQTLQEDAPQSFPCSTATPTKILLRRLFRQDALYRR